MATGTKVGDIYYDLDLDDSKFSAGSKRIKSELHGIDGAFRSAEKGSQIFLGALTALSVAGVAAIGFGVKIAGDLESARQGFVALLGSAEEADKTMARIKKEAAATPFELTGLVTGAQALTAVTKDGDKAVDTLLDVGKAIATSGKGQAELDRVVLNLQQIASTGKVTAMDIRQFQGAIPMFNDILESAGMTSEELQNSSTAAEDLFEAFKTAGQEGGITAQGFEAQAGTFNQLWSNLVDTMTIGMSEFVKTSGIFDAVKTSLSGIIDALGQFTTPESIQFFVTFVQDNFPIIAGIIIGGITPALWGMATAAWAAFAPLLPFIAAGAALGLIIKLIVDRMGGWQAVMEQIQPVLDIFGLIFQELILPKLKEVWELLSSQLLPALQELWAVLEPVLIPVLQGLATIMGAVLVGAFYTFIEILKWTINALTDVANVVKFFVEKVHSFFVWLFDVLVGNSIIPELIEKIWWWFESLPGKVKDALSNLADVIMQPFKQAWEYVEPILNKMKEGLEKINPFHRESPSLVDNVRSGVNEIMNQYGKLSSLTVPNIALAAIPSDGARGTEVNQNINVHVGQVGDMQDITALGREFGYRVGLEPL